MVKVVGVIGDAGTNDVKLMVGCFTGHAMERGQMRVYLDYVFPCAIFYAKQGYLDISMGRSFEMLADGKEPQYYPTFDKPVDSRPESTFRKRCADIILEQAKKIRDKGVFEELKWYSENAKTFMRKAEDFFEVNGLP